MNLKELLEKRAALVAKMKTLHELAGTENRSLSDDENTQWATWEKELGELKAAIARAELVETEERLAATSQPKVGPLGGGAPALIRRDGIDADTRAALHYLRTGNAAGLAEVRAYNNTDMNITTAADGGYAVPTALYNNIVARRDESMIRDRIGCVNMGGKGTTMRVPIDNEADVLFTSEAEAAAIDQDAPDLYYKDLTLVKYAKYITLSWELLRDEDANLMSFLSNWIGRGWAATHNYLLVTEAQTSGTAGLTLDSASAIGAAEIPELVGKLQPEYQEGAQWLLNPTVVAYLQGLSGNAFYFAPGANGYAGKPSLWGYPVNQSAHASAIAESAKSLIFGNFSFMGFREGTGLTMLRDPYTGAGNGQLKLWFWFDAVYGVLQAEAIQYATHPTA